MTDFPAPPLQITFHGRVQQLVPLEEFRTAHNLPNTFDITLFEPTGITYHPVWSQKTMLANLHEHLYTVVPEKIPLPQLNQIPHMLALIFQNEMITRGADAGLEVDDVEQVATDLQNILETAAYKLLELFYQQGQSYTAVGQQFDNTAVYQEVLDSTVHLGTTEHTYQHHDQTWTIHVIHTVYGPLGLHITSPTTPDPHLVADRTLAFPALDFIASTGLALSQAMCAGFLRAGHD